MEKFRVKYSKDSIVLSLSTNNQDVINAGIILQMIENMEDVYTQVSRFCIKIVIPTHNFATSESITRLIDTINDRLSINFNAETAVDFE